MAEAEDAAKEVEERVLELALEAAERVEPLLERWSEAVREDSGDARLAVLDGPYVAESSESEDDEDELDEDEWSLTVWLLSEPSSSEPEPPPFGSGVGGSTKRLND